MELRHPSEIVIVHLEDDACEEESRSSPVPTETYSYIRTPPPSYETVRRPRFIPYISGFAELPKPVNDHTDSNASFDMQHLSLGQRTVWILKSWKHVVCYDGRFAFCACFIMCTLVILVLTCIIVLMPSLLKSHK